MKNETKKSTILVTGLESFYRATSKDGETRYFAIGSIGTKLAASEFDKNDDTVTVKGFAVYDTTVSTEYAVALYPTQKEADDHKAKAAPKTPTTAIEDDDETHASDCSQHNAPAYAAEDCDCDTAEATPAKPVAQRNKKKSRRGGI